jgi:ParB family transcriptional regulator, chromosome partitioning protein
VERRSGLGKGLAALLPSEVTSTGAETGAVLRDIPINDIEPNPNQPRRHFDEEALVDLSASIREIGVLQPILVRPLDGARFQLIAGERRWRAAKRAGLDVIPAVIRHTADLSSVEQALVENLHRSDLSALEEAAAYHQLIEDFNLTHDDVAKRMSKSRAAITNTLRLLHLPASIQGRLVDGQLSAGHARALLAVTDRPTQELLAQQAIAEGWSVRALEDKIRTPVAPESGSGDGARPIPGIRPLREPGLLELEQLLSDHLDTRVQISMGPRRGKVVVEFADLEDLERIYRRMTEPSIGG